MRKNCSTDRDKLFKLDAGGQEFENFFEIIRTIFSNGERSEQFLKQNDFLTCSWRFLRSNTLQQLEYKLENIIVT